MKYFVVKNVENDKYFRGKGKNQWGKYLNQASIYRMLNRAESSAAKLAKKGYKVHIVSIEVHESNDCVIQKNTNVILTACDIFNMCT